MYFSPFSTVCKSSRPSSFLCVHETAQKSKKEFYVSKNSVLHPSIGPDFECSVKSRVGIKKPTQKNPPKKTQKTHLKKPTKNVFFVSFFGFFWVFLNFLFFMKIIQTFLFHTDFS